MRSLLPSILFAYVLLSGFFLVKPVSATTIFATPFVELVLTCDFVGTAECVQAGGSVAKFKVLESFQGPAAGSIISIRVSYGFMGSNDDYALILCGERYLITAYKVDGDEPHYKGLGTGVPVSWRDTPADFRTPKWQGVKLLSPDRITKRVVDSDMEMSVEVARELLALSPAEQELKLLKSGLESSVFIAGTKSDRDTIWKNTTFYKQFAAMKSGEVVATELIKLAQKDPKRWSLPVSRTLMRGKQQTLDVLEKMPREQSPWDKETLDQLLYYLKKNMGQEAPPPHPAYKSPESTEADLIKFRHILNNDLENRGYNRAFDKLMMQDQPAVLQALLKWTETPAARSSMGGYAYGSYFAWRCEKNRVQNLTAMLGAKDPFVRVAGAVYLCFEDEAQGIIELKKLAKLNGEPGTWAALTLARRGLKDYVPRALEAYPKPTPAERENGMYNPGTVSYITQYRVMELLSNAAQNSSLPYPVVEESHIANGELLKAWWKKYGHQAKTDDPWLTILTSQKVD